MARLKPFVFASLLLSLVGATRPRIVYFDPDANHSAILNIVDWFNQFLTARGLDLELQPVQQEAQFEKLLEDPDTQFALTTSTLLNPGGRLKPLLVPTLHGNAYHHKVLVDLGHGPLADLHGLSLAVAVPQQHSKEGIRQVLTLLARGGINVNGVIPIPVPKDIDALLALSFGQVQSAFVTPQSIELLRNKSPQVAASFRVTFESPPLLDPPLCVVGERASPQQVERLTEALHQMAEDSLGLRTLQTMGFDDWIRFLPNMWPKGRDL